VCDFYVNSEFTKFIVIYFSRFAFPFLIVIFYDFGQQKKGEMFCKMHFCLAFNYLLLWIFTPLLPTRFPFNIGLFFVSLRFCFVFLLEIKR